MLKIFDRDGKLNFVDTNNVVVGFASYQSCCENWGWYITPEEPTEETLDFSRSDGDKDFPTYNFDPQYFVELTSQTISEVNAAVVFKLVSNSAKDLYLVLYNCHNGYYSHGFTCTVGGIQTQSGHL